jgi:hypothetical protein
VIIVNENVLMFGKIAITTEYSIFKVLLIEFLDYSLLFVSQLCKMGYNYLFTNKGVVVFRRSGDFFAFKGVLRGNFALWISSSRKCNLTSD